jgi:hypothetical protein
VPIGKLLEERLSALGYRRSAGKFVPISVRDPRAESRQLELFDKHPGDWTLDDEASDQPSAISNRPEGRR